MISFESIAVSIVKSIDCSSGPSNCVFPRNVKGFTAWLEADVNAAIVSRHRGDLRLRFGRRFDLKYDLIVGVQHQMPGSGRDEDADVLGECLPIFTRGLMRSQSPWILQTPESGSCPDWVQPAWKI